MADLVQPRLTVVAQPAYALGKEAAVLLFSRMTCPSLAGETVVLPVEIVLRGSCGCGEDAFDFHGLVRAERG
jgi:DNA-binding LacI/PurR family transcriptional regulator